MITWCSECLHCACGGPFLVRPGDLSRNHRTKGPSRNGSSTASNHPCVEAIQKGASRLTLLIQRPQPVPPRVARHFLYGSISAIVSRNTMHDSPITVPSPTSSQSFCLSRKQTGTHNVAAEQLMTQLFVSKQGFIVRSITKHAHRCDTSFSPQLDGQY